MPPIRGASRTTTCSTLAMLSADFCCPFGGLRERRRVPHQLCFRLFSAAHSGGFENYDVFHIDCAFGRSLPPFWGASTTTTCSTSAVLSVDFCRPFGGLRERRCVPPRLCFSQRHAAPFSGGLREPRRVPPRLSLRRFLAALVVGFKNDDAFHLSYNLG